MKYKAYSNDVWNQINKALDTVLQQDSQPVAAFDADGTLWDTDLGEAFFNYLIDHKLVNLPPSPWEYYQTAKKDPAGPQRAYLWLAQILKDQPFDTVKEWAEKSVQEFNPLPYFPDQKKLIDLFQSRGVKVYVVTASVKWAVEPGAKVLGLNPDQVIGIETQIQNNIVTDIPHGVVTYREGKVTALLEKTNGKKPFFTAGNTLGDKNLLESATHLRMAVTSTHPDDKLFRSEQELIALARQNGWLTHKFNEVDSD